MRRIGRLDRAAPRRGAVTRPAPPRVSRLRVGVAPATTAPAAQWERADVRGLRVERPRDFGESHLGLRLPQGPRIIVNAVPKSAS